MRAAPTLFAWVGLVLVGVGWESVTVVAQQAANRRDRRDPELILETGFRSGPCDALSFAQGDRFLLAAGDDKVVRSWRINAQGIDTTSSQVFRWPSWREQRGAIYAMALSPDPENRLLAFGGHGLRISSVVVVDRLTGELVAMHHPTGVVEGGRIVDDYVVRSLAFQTHGARAGRLLAMGLEDGGVWVWDIDHPKSVRRLGGHADDELAKAKGDFELCRVRWLGFRDASTLWSLADDGRLLAWDLTAPAGTPPKQVLALTDPTGKRLRLLRGQVDLHHGWLVAAGVPNRLIVRSLQRPDDIRDLELPPHRFVRNLALAPNGKLAVAVGEVLEESKFYLEKDDAIYLVDLNRGAAKQPIAWERGPKTSGRVEAFAWDRAGRLAVALGEHHSVVLFRDLGEQAKPWSTALGPGRNVWGVRLSTDGRYVGLQEERLAVPTDPNVRATSALRAYDLRSRKFVIPRVLKAIQWHDTPRELPAEMGGWKVQAKGGPYAWQVTSKYGTWDLPWVAGRDGAPRCWAFLRPQPGQPAKLLVGHYWGMSMFDLTEQGPRRSQIFTGHGGEVMSIAVSADQTWCVTSANDQTVNAWSLQPWPSQPQLGAAFRAEQDQLVVQTVDVGSPAWEAGLMPNDRIVLLGRGREVVFNRTPLYGGKTVGSARDWGEPMQRTEPGTMLHFGLRRAGEKEIVQAQSSARQRPLWRWFGTTEEQPQWILWMWRGGYYDTSINGDSYIGWLINDESLSKLPRFVPAEKLRLVFHREAVINRLLIDRQVGPALTLALGESGLPNFENVLPPLVELRTNRVQIQPGEPILATLMAGRDGENPDRQPMRVELWINDFRFAVWQPNGMPFHKQVEIPSHEFRSGANTLILQSFNRVGGRSEVTLQLRYPRPEKAVRLHGVLIGINDYSRTSVPNQAGKRGPLSNLLTAQNDASRLQQTWNQQRPELFARTDLRPLLGASASRQEILEALDRLARRSDLHPDDRLVLMFAGHGTWVDDPQRKGEKLFVFCCPEFDLDHWQTTGISSRELYEKLAQIRCRKIVLLDACHSGEATTNPVRELTPGGQGPIIMAACDQKEEAFENAKLGHGLFTYALLEALGERFEQADVSRDGQLDARELFGYVRKRMPSLLEEIGRGRHEQNPVAFPAELPDFGLATRSAK